MIFVYMFRAAFESVSKKSKVGVAGIAGTTGTAEKNSFSQQKLMKRFPNTLHSFTAHYSGTILVHQDLNLDQILRTCQGQRATFSVYITVVD